MDISETLAPKSDQQNFDDYLTGPRTVTIAAVDVPGGDQPVKVELVEYPGRPFKPNKSMRRVLASAWGPESSAWIGRRLTLVGNPKVVYGGKAVGGIEIAAMSHLDKRLTLSLTETRGKKRSFTVDPLTDAKPAPVKPPEDAPNWHELADLAKGDTAALRALWMSAIKNGADTDALDYIKATADEAKPKEPNA